MRTPLASVLFALALATGCGGDDAAVEAGPDGRPATGVPARPADLVGVITAIAPFEPVTEDCVPADDLDPDGVVSSDDPPICTDPDSDILGSVLVEADPASESGDKISFTVTESTFIGWRYVSTDEPELMETSFASLREGDRVEAWHTGQVAESFPGQATAVALLTEDPGS